MRFFTKLYALMLILMTLTLALTEYIVVSSSLDTSIETQVEADLKQHQLVKLAIQSGIMNVMRQNPVDSNTVYQVAQQSADTMDVVMEIFNETDGLVYSLDAELFSDLKIPEAIDGAISYQVSKLANSHYLVVISRFTQNDYTMNLVTVTDISSIFDSATKLQARCDNVFLVFFVVGAVVAALFSMFITKPIKELTEVGKRFSAGDYSMRANSFPRDEIGDLSHTFNGMADSIEDKIAELQLAVKQQEDFTAAFAHELKTPMTSIIGYADTLYQKNLPIEEAKEAAGYILNEGMRLEALSFKLMKLINISKSEFLLEETSMVEFMKDVEGSVAHLSNRRSIPVEFHVEEGYVKIEMDLFKTMILNLIDNAMKADSKNVAVLGWVEEDNYRIAIVDNGRGIPADELSRVTEAFYMVDKARSRKENGAGLGLALCQKIAVIHHSSLNIWSEVGKGTAVRLALKLEGDQVDDDEE